MQNSLHPSLTCAFVAFALIAAVDCTAILNVAVYYIARHQPSSDFIVNQLYPTYVALNSAVPSYMDIEFVPFGDVMTVTEISNGTWKLDCIGNGYDCYYNKMHACIAHLGIEKSWIPLKFIDCDATYSLQGPLSCMERTCYQSYGEVSDCVNSVDGDRLLVELGIKTAALGAAALGDLPVVVFNGEYDVSEQSLARENLLQLACLKIGNRTTVCSQPRAYEQMTHNNFGSDSLFPREPRCALNSS